MFKRTDSVLFCAKKWIICMKRAKIIPVYLSRLIFHKQIRQEFAIGQEKSWNAEKLKKV